MKLKVLMILKEILDVKKTLENKSQNLIAPPVAQQQENNSLEIRVSHALRAKLKRTAQEEGISIHD